MSVLNLAYNKCRICGTTWVKVMFDPRESFVDGVVRDLYDAPNKCLPELGGCTSPGAKRVTLDGEMLVWGERREC
jgi:hypothetical protein